MNGGNRTHPLPSGPDALEELGRPRGGVLIKERGNVSHPGLCDPLAVHLGQEIFGGGPGEVPVGIGSDER